MAPGCDVALSADAGKILNDAAVKISAISADAVIEALFLLNILFPFLF